MGWQGIAQTLVQLEICTSPDPPGLLQKRDYKAIRYRYFRSNAGDVLFRLHDAVLTCRKLDLSKNRVGIHNLHYIFVS